MIDGRIVKTGGHDLAHRIEREGYDKRCVRRVRSLPESGAHRRRSRRCDATALRARRQPSSLSPFSLEQRTRRARPLRFVASGREKPGRFWRVDFESIAPEAGAIDLAPRTCALKISDPAVFVCDLATAARESPELFARAFGPPASPPQSSARLQRPSRSAASSCTYEPTMLATTRSSSATTRPPERQSFRGASCSPNAARASRSSNVSKAARSLSLRCHRSGYGRARGRPLCRFSASRRWRASNLESSRASRARSADVVGLGRARRRTCR